MFAKIEGYIRDGQEPKVVARHRQLWKQILLLLLPGLRQARRSVTLPVHSGATPAKALECLETISRISRLHVKNASIVAQEVITELTILQGVDTPKPPAIGTHDVPVQSNSAVDSHVSTPEDSRL